MFEKIRIKYAAKCGKIEHCAGIFISLPPLWIMLFGSEPDFWMAAWTELIWIVYITAHTFEKKIYGNLGSRTRRK